MHSSLPKQLRVSAFAVLLAAQAAAQESATVPAESDIYRRVEAISAFFPVSVHLGLRPSSVRAMRITVEQLARAIAAAPPSHPRRSWAEREVRLLQAALATDTTRFVTRGSWLVDGYRSSAQSHRIDSNGLGVLDATENAFASGRQGLPLPQGAALALMPTAVAGARNFAALVQPEVVAQGDARGQELHLRVHRAYARARLRNMALQLGSDAMRWGQSARAPLFISGHAAAFPLVSVGTDTGITLPWLFRLAGPVRGQLFVADLGPTQEPRRARLAGWQVNMHPWPRFELGVSVLTHTGGQGGPPATFLERVVDLLPVIDALAPQRADLQFSNKIAGGSLRLRVPELSGLDVYYELALDDFDGRRLVSSFVDDAGHLLGARVAAGSAVWRGEVHRTSLRLYEHAQFRSGLTYRQRLIGSPLGPNAWAGYLMLDRPLGERTRMELTAGDERRDPSQYTVTVSGEFDRGFRFVRLTNDPDIRRVVLTGSLDHWFMRAGVRLTAGYARAWREPAAPRNEWLMRLAFQSRHLAAF